MSYRSNAIVVSCLSLAMLVGAASTAEARHQPPARPGSAPGGLTYSEWAAEWWQFAIGTTASENVFVTEDCTLQPNDDVWFLAGDLFGAGPITRTCEMPEGTSLLVPISATFYGAFPDDPAEQQTEEYVRSQVTCEETVHEMSLYIDGVPVGHPQRFFEQSIVFDLVLEEGNLFGLPGGFTLSPSVDSGYYVFLEALEEGEHILEWYAETDCSVQDVTYFLTVTG